MKQRNAAKETRPPKRGLVKKNDRATDNEGVTAGKKHEGKKKGTGQNTGDRKKGGARGGETR